MFTTHVSYRSAFIALFAAVCLFPIGSQAQIGKLFVPPGREGSFQIKSEPYKPANVQEIGQIAGRAVQIIDTPIIDSEMGKQMVVSSDDAVWFLLTREDKVVRVDPKTLEMIAYTMPSGSGPYSLAMGSDDTIWITAHGIEMLMEFIPQQNKVITHQPPGHGFLVHIGVDTWRDIVYFAQPGSNKVCSFTRGKGFREFSVPTKESGPARLAIQEDGTVWFPELYANKLARLNPDSGEIKEWDLPTASGFPSFARVGKDGGVWLSQPMADRLVKFDPKSEKFLEFTVPTKNSVVSTQLEDGQGNVWFTEGGWRGSAGGNKIGVMLTSGRFEELSIPIQNAQPAGITITKKGEVWFQLSSRGKVCRVAAPSEHVALK